jgi:hypothetical protein
MNMNSLYRWRPQLVWRSVVLGIACLCLIHLPALSQEEEETEENEPWNFSAGLSYVSRYTGFGVDLSQDEPALSLETLLHHESGWSAGIDAIARTGEQAGYQQSSIHLGYAREVIPSLTLSGTYTYYSYKSDTVSVLAGISNGLAVNGTLALSPVSLSLGYNLFFGNATANYLSASLSATFETTRFSIDPSVGASFAAQTVAVSLLPKNRGKGKANGQGQGKGQGQGQSQTSILASDSSETISGLSSLSLTVGLSCSLGSGFTVSFTPSYEYSPSDLGARRSQFVWTAGLSYVLDF